MYGRAVSLASLALAQISPSCEEIPGRRLMRSDGKDKARGTLARHLSCWIPAGAHSAYIVQMTQLHNTVFHLHCRACVKQLVSAFSSSSTAFKMDREVSELNMRMLHIPWQCNKVLFKHERELRCLHTGLLGWLQQCTLSSPNSVLAGF